MLSDWINKLKSWALKPAPVANGTLSPSTAIAPVPANQPGTGALLDTRTAAQQETDVHFGEIVSNAAAVNWPARTPDAWRKFAIFNQNGCSACVAFTMAKMLGILRWLNDGVFVVFSMGDIYTRRTTAGEGMAATDVFAIGGQGVTLDTLMPSQNLTDVQINALKRTSVAAEVAAIFRLAGSQAIVAPTRDIDAIASIIQQTKKPVMVWYFFTSAEWSLANGVPGDYNVPSVLIPDLSVTDDARGALRHSLTAVDFTLDALGRKCLIIEDSSWFGGYNRRVVTEDFHKKRNWYAGYPMNFARIKATVAPDLSAIAPFTKNLAFIAWDNTKNQPADMIANAAQLTDVIRLQQVLQILTDSRGNTYFPLNIECTGYYGAATAAGVLAWQSDNNVATQSALDSLAGKSFGPASIAAMNAIIKQ